MPNPISPSYISSFFSSPSPAPPLFYSLLTLPSAGFLSPCSSPGLSSSFPSSFMPMSSPLLTLPDHFITAASQPVLWLPLLKFSLPNPAGSPSDASPALPFPNRQRRCPLRLRSSQPRLAPLTRRIRHLHLRPPPPMLIPRLRPPLHPLPPRTHPLPLLRPPAQVVAVVVVMSRASCLVLRLEKVRFVFAYARSPLLIC